MPRSYHHLGLAEREKIMRMRDAKVPVSRMAVELGRHPVTIYRELRRNYFYDDDAYFRGYLGCVAHSKAAARRERGGKVVRNPSLATRIAQDLARCWSPEQIAGRLRLDAIQRSRPATTSSPQTFCQPLRSQQHSRSGCEGVSALVRGRRLGRK